MTDGEAAKLWAARKQQQYPHAEALFANPKSKKIRIWEALTTDVYDASLADAAATFVCEVQKSQDAGKLVTKIKDFNAIVLVPSNHALRTIPKDVVFAPADYVIQLPAGNKLETSARFSALKTASQLFISVKLENNKIIIANLDGTFQKLGILKQYTFSNGTIYVIDGVYKNDDRQKSLKSAAAYPESDGILGRLTSGSLATATAYNALTIPVYDNKKLIKTAEKFMAQVNSENDVKNVLSSSETPITVFVPRNEAFQSRDNPNFTVKSHILLGENVDILKVKKTPYKTLMGDIKITYVNQKLGSIFRKLILVDYAGVTQPIVILDKYAIENGTIYVVDQLIRGYDAAAVETSHTPEDLPDVYTRPPPDAKVGMYIADPGYPQPKF